MSNPKHQGGNSGGYSLSLSTFTRCGKKHKGKCLVGVDGCFNSGKHGHRIRDYQSHETKVREGKQAPHYCSGSSAPGRVFWDAICGYEV